MSDNKQLRVIGDIITNVVLVLVAVVFVIFCGNKAYTFGHSVFNEESLTSATSPSYKEVNIVIDDTELKAEKIAKKLFDAGLVKEKLVTRIQIELSDLKNELKAGTYKLSTAMTISQMLEIISGGNE